MTEHGEINGRRAPISIRDIVPAIPEVMLIAARRELNHPNPNRSFLRQAGKSISNQLPQGSEAQAAALATLGDIEAKAGSQSVAAQYYLKSLKLESKNHRVQVKLIESLQASGDPARAQQQARHWSTVSPDNQALQELLD